MEKFLHKKSLGQNFLNSDYVPKKMCDAAIIENGDVVLEIGPGTGALTRELLARGATVIAVETDARAIEILKETFAPEIAANKLLLKKSDARFLDMHAPGLKDKKFKVVSNIPYYLSGMLLRNCLDTDIQPTTLVFLMQKELVERIARTAKESLLSLSIKAFGKPSYVTTVKKSHFTPQPKVDSAILLVSDISHEKFAGSSSDTFFTLLKLGFGQKRKQLQHNLQSILPKAVIFKAFSETDLKPTVRAEDISLDQWLMLTKVLKSKL